MDLSPDFDDNISDLLPGDEHLLVLLNDRGIVFLDSDEENDADGSEQRPKKRGPKTGDVWELFTEVYEPQRLSRASACIAIRSSTITRRSSQSKNT
jgi:hypothetical protein